MNKEIVAALTSHLVKDLAPLPTSVWRVVKGTPGDDLLEFARAALAERDADLVRERLDRVEEFSDALCSLGEMGISFLTEFSFEYPDNWKAKLGGRTPSHLFVAGNVGLLRMASLGVVGSREVDEAGTTFTRALAAESARQGLAIVSGGARGVDEIAMRSAYESGGAVIGILAESLTRNLRRWDLESERVCLASPFAPDVGFQVANAMTRNKLIYAASEATVVVSSAMETGGTWAGATEALKQSLCPLLVRAGEDVPDGNRALIGKGGIPMTSPLELLDLMASAQPAQGSLL